MRRTFTQDELSAMVAKACPGVEIGRIMFRDLERVVTVRPYPVTRGIGGYVNREWHFSINESGELVRIDED